MRRPIERTNRKGLYVIYYETTKKGKKIITAQLTDEHGMAIDGCSASHTLRPYDDDDNARIAARNKALKKFDERFRQNFAEGLGDTTDFFRSRWLDISEDKRLDLAPEGKGAKYSRASTIKYFENNVLPLLDMYGPFITGDECRTVSEALYAKTLMAKNYTYCFVDKDATPAITSLIGEFNQFMTRDNRAKNVLGVFPKQDDINSLADIIQNQVLSEDRLRSLLEYSLTGDAHPENFMAHRLWPKIEKDGTLIAQLRKLKFEANRLAVAERVVFYLRELCGDEVQTKSQANIHIRDANEILKNLAIASDTAMPMVSLPEFFVNRAPQIEACKELPWKVRVRFAAICMHIADEDPNAVGGIIMATAGPRVAELCAIQYGDILDFGTWGVCVINYTVDGDIRKADGKNIYFHRPIFFTRFAMDAIHKRKHRLKELGYTEDQIKNAYVVNRDGDLFMPANPHVFSAKIKKILKIAGCTDDYWDSVRYAMTVQPDLDYFRRPEVFDIAYGLRRDATTMMCNVARMHPFKVDAILGHCLPRYADDWHSKITREDEWKVIIAEMERIVYDPEHSHHPLFAARNAQSFQADSNTDQNDIAYHGFTITTDKPVRVKVKVKTVGNADVHFTLSSKQTKHHSSIESVSNSAEPSKWLGVLHSKEEYEQVKMQAIIDYLKEVKT